MIKPHATYLLLPAFLIVVTTVFSTPRIVQSRLVVFPKAGPVLVQAREETGHNPKIVVLAQHSRKVLLTHEISAPEDELKPTTDQPPVYNAFVRFQVLRPACFATPLILATAVAPGGSDHGFWSAVIGETNGKLTVLIPNALNHVQGGLYLGYLNKQFGCGFVGWNFVWNDGSHYDQHPYEVEIYMWRGGQLVPQPKYESKRKYVGNGAAALRELGIRAQDQRRQIAKVKRYVE